MFFMIILTYVTCYKANVGKDKNFSQVCRTFKIYFNISVINKHYGYQIQI